MIFNHGLSRTGFANARPGRARSPSAPLGRARTPTAPHIATSGRACAPRTPHWLVTVCSFFALVLTSFAADPAITVSARQRYPWNGLVDVHFTITGDAGTKYDTSFTAKDMVGNTNIAMRTVRKSDGTAANMTKEQLLPGTYNWVWDAAADLPKDFKCNRVTVTGAAFDEFPYFVKFNANGGSGTMANESFTYGTAKALTANAFKRTGYSFQGWATSASGAKVYNDKQSVSNLTETSGAVVNLYAVWKSALYMVVDLSSGASSSSYPVSYLDAAPSGGWGSAYKTTKLVLRKCSKGKDPKGRYTLTKGFYIGVFEVTCKQYYLVMGSWPSGHGESDACQPAEYITWNIARGNNWPGNTSPAANSFTGKLRSRTGLLADLPTEAQWEYACRAGTTSSFNNGGNDEAALKKVGRYYGNSSGTYNGQQGHWSSAVGSYKANAWGIYDMHGNLWELCLDWYGSSTPSGTDPKGPSSGTYRVSKGGSLYAQWNSCTSSSRIEGSTGSRTFEDGFRVCVTLSE